MVQFQMPRPAAGGEVRQPWVGSMSLGLLRVRLVLVRWPEGLSREVDSPRRRCEEPTGCSAVPQIRMTVVASRH